MNENSSESRVSPETRRNGPVQEIEFQVSSVLNRLEAAVEKFEGNSPFSILDSKKLSSLVPRSTEDTLDLIEDAIINLDLSKDDEESNLAILPALRDVDKLSLLSHSIKNYILCLDIAHSDQLIDWIIEETSNWVKDLFKFEDGSVFFTENSLEGCTKLFRLLLIRRYRTFNHDGFEAFKECEPVIYYNTPAMFVIAQYLCSNLGLPLRFTREVPLFPSQKKDEIEIFQRILAEDLSKQRVPLLFLAGAETQISPSQCNLNDLRNICREQKIWLHLTGSFVAALPLLKKRPEEQNSPIADSFTVTLGSWLNVPALPTVTVYKSHPDDSNFPTFTASESHRAICYPLWSTILSLGPQKILEDFTQKFDSCQKLYCKLETHSCLKLLSQPPLEKNVNTSVVNLLSKQNDLFELVVSSVIFKFYPVNNHLWAPSYCDKLNSWLSQVLHRELPVVPISTAELKDYGTVLCYSPFANVPTISESNWIAFHACLKQQLDILKSTVAQKETLYKLIEKSTCLKMVELPDWAGLGGVRYIPEAWYRDRADDVSKEELNRLNLQIVQQLRNTDSAFSIGESTDGYSCIRFGMVGWDSDVADLISLVETVGKQEEDSWNFIDTMAEVVKKGIETAMQDLQKENEEKLWQEGILRHVPVFGNIVNWWSPISKENGGIKGRSLDLSAGVIESTENIYRNHKQQKSTRKPSTEISPEPAVAAAPETIVASDSETAAEPIAEANGEKPPVEV